MIDKLIAEYIGVRLDLNWGSILSSQVHKTVERSWFCLAMEVRRTAWGVLHVEELLSAD